MKTIDRDALLIKPGQVVRLGDLDPGVTGEFKTKFSARQKLRSDLKRLAELQEMFFADGRRSLLLIFEGMDAAGKDGAVAHVMSGVDPQGVDVHSFKTPSTEELAHDFLWRSVEALPARGRIGIFNRSYYEELSIVRVHPAVLDHEGLPPEAMTPDIWKDRFEDIVAFERHLARNGTIVLKFFLHLSKEEQRKRLLKRIDTPDKNWKLSESDIQERAYWDSYQTAYEEILANSSTDFAPWYVIPADHKWFGRTAIADIIVARLEALYLSYPKVDAKQKAFLESAREQLKSETDY
jgi:PPK2 family polyphosphate:nucleotide phosphotransferase